MDHKEKSCTTCIRRSYTVAEEPCFTCVQKGGLPYWEPHAVPTASDSEQMANQFMDAVYANVAATKGLGATPEAMANGGVKFDADKPRMDLLDSYAIAQLSLVLAFGAKKYDAHNWRKGIAKSRLIAAALRHLFAYLGGEDKDPETGLSHAAHAMCCCMFLLGLEHRADLDDRWKEAA